MLVDEKEGQHDPALCPGSLEIQLCPGLLPKPCGKQGREEVLPLCSALLCSGETSCSDVPSSGADNKRRTWISEKAQRRQ